MESFQNVFFSSDLSVFLKKANFWEFWEFLGKKNFGTHSRWNLKWFLFLKTCEHFFWTYYLFSQIKNQFRKFWELLSNNTIQDAFCKKVAKFSNFSKKSSSFPKKTSFSSKKSKFWTFWELLNINTFRDVFRSFFWTFAFLKKSEDFSKRIQILNDLRFFDPKFKTF